MPAILFAKAGVLAALRFYVFARILVLILQHQNLVLGLFREGLLATSTSTTTAAARDRAPSPASEEEPSCAVSASWVSSASSSSSSRSSGGVQSASSGSTISAGSLAGRTLAGLGSLDLDFRVG